MEGTIFNFWNWTVAVYLFVAGVSAGAFAISALAYFLGEEKYQDITRIGAYIAPFPLMIGLLFLIYDLERPHLFWKLMVTLQVHSIMSLGAWLLVIFSLLSSVYFYLWLPDRFDIVEMLRQTPQSWDRWAIFRRLKTSRLVEKLRRKNLNAFRGWVAMAGIPVSLLVGIYTGVLLGALVARPFWNNPMLPMLFLVSALKTGTASICLVGCVVKGIGGMSRKQIETNKFVIHSIDFFLMILSIIAILLFVFGLYAAPRSSVEAAGLIMGGEFTFLFWGLAVVVGILFPLSLEVYELIPHFISRTVMRKHNPWISGAVTLSVLVGGFVLRYVVVYAGQVAKIVAT
ncbi:MAG: NrfD/PsrC family molybdoenzyme membrane anchor subunit [Syntrophales bacterium]|nr:NrfD/PsrC family molybdoenzyme membrane anchor subunit [Syntrophales bacterium]